MKIIRSTTSPPETRMVIAISSRALFNLEESHQVFLEQGVDAYSEYQIEREDNLLLPGVAFSLVKKLLSINRLNGPRIEVMLLSKNSPDTGLRIFNSIQHYGLDISRAVFSRGKPIHPYIEAFGAHLFLSSDPTSVAEALHQGYAAATILPSQVTVEDNPQLKIAFDGDAVLFSDDAERIYQSKGLEAFVRSETAAARTPLPGGPFKQFLTMLHEIQSHYPIEDAPIRTALVTARAAPTHERVIRTFRAWNIRIDESIFLGGLPKGAFLKAFGADIFFDDQTRHCQSAANYVPTGHVPHGIINAAGSISP